MTKIYHIALNTYRESVRSKILYSILFFGLIVVLVSAFFGTVTIGDQVKVIKNFGLLSISLFSVAFAVISGGALLHKELSRKTVYNILAKPVHRWEFLCGKYFGMLLTAGTMVGLMGLGLLLFVFIFEWSVDIYMLQAYYHIVLELAVICAAAIFFSSIVVTPMLSGLFTFGIFLAGRCIEYLLFFVKEGSIDGILAYLLKGLYWFLPHLKQVIVNDMVVNGSPSTWQHSVWSTLYVAGYAVVLLVFANVIFKRREFN